MDERRAASSEIGLAHVASGYARKVASRSRRRQACDHNKRSSYVAALHRCYEAKVQRHDERSSYRRYEPASQRIQGWIRVG